MTDMLGVGRAVLARQPFSVYLGTELAAFAPGRAVLTLAVRAEFLQQYGYVHGGVVSYLIDNALTFAGGSVLGENVITVEYKVNYMRPARGQRLAAAAVVESSGNRLAVCRCEVLALEDGKETRCAIGQGTIIARS